jgi:hypothetical protein
MGRVHRLRVPVNGRPRPTRLGSEVSPGSGQPGTQSSTPARVSSEAGARSTRRRSGGPRPRLRPARRGPRPRPRPLARVEDHQKGRASLDGDTGLPLSSTPPPSTTSRPLSSRQSTTSSRVRGPSPPSSEASPHDAMGPSAPNARHTAATGGTGQTQLTFNSVEDRGPQWSPDGSKIVWARDLDGGTFDNSEIFLMNADGTGTQQLKFNGHFDCYPRSRRTARRSRTSRSRAAGATTSGR